MIGFWVSITFTACSILTGACELQHMRAPVYAPIARYSPEWCRHTGVFFADKDVRRSFAKPYPYVVAIGSVHCALLGGGE